MQIGHALFSLTQTADLTSFRVLRRRQPCTVIAHPVCPLIRLFILEDLTKAVQQHLLFPFQFLQPFKLLTDTGKFYSDTW